VLFRSRFSNKVGVMVDNPTFGQRITTIKTDSESPAGNIRSGNTTPVASTHGIGFDEDVGITIVIDNPLFTSGGASGGASSASASGSFNSTNPMLNPNASPAAVPASPSSSTSVTSSYSKFSTTKVAPSPKKDEGSSPFHNAALTDENL